MVGDQLARPAEGRLWARHVDALLDRSGRAPAHEIHYLDAIGSIAARSGEYPVAEAILRDALARAESLEPRDDLAIAHALGTLASVLGVNGKTVEAVALERRVLAVREAALGPLHPDLGVTLTNLGVGHMLLGEYAEAEQAQRRALELWRVSMPAGARARRLPALRPRRPRARARAPRRGPRELPGGADDLGAQRRRPTTPPRCSCTSASPPRC
jgi:tetratricopeptide (TPR) repeat protein